MRWLLPVLILVPLWACGPDVDQNPVLSGRGLGQVTIGMTPEAAAAALGAPLHPRSGSEESCWYTTRADGIDSAVLYMISDGAVVRIDARQGAAITDAKGFGVGASEQAVIAAYGEAAKTAPHKYVEGGHTLRIAGPGDTALVFETGEGKVTTLRAGRVPFVDYVEGCS